MSHEGKGIDKKVIDFCDECVQIEMQEGIKSFNVSVASAILMYQFINKLDTKVF
jgi:tRNA G18 (ribose-2'-O)-methylase SpoU